MFFLCGHVSFEIVCLLDLIKRCGEFSGRIQQKQTGRQYEARKSSVTSINYMINIIDDCISRKVECTFSSNIRTH